MDSGREKNENRKGARQAGERNDGGSNSKSWEKSLVGSFPCPHPEPFWTPSCPGSPFPLGKLLGGLLKSLPRCPPSPSDQAKPEPVGGQSAHSALSLGRAFE